MATKEREQYQASLMQLIGSRPVAYWPALAKQVGGVKAAVMLSQLLYWNGDKGVQKKDGWIYKSVEEMEDETGLTKVEQQTARKELAALGIISVKLKGIPRVWYYKVNIDALGEILIGKESHPMENSSNEKPSDIGTETLPILDDFPAQLNESETTPKTIQKTTIGADAPAAPKIQKEFIDGLERYFLIKTGLPVPRRNTKPEIKEYQKLWANPLKEIGEIAGADFSVSTTIIDHALTRLQGMTVSDPHSIIKTARAVLPKVNGNSDTRAYSEVY